MKKLITLVTTLLFYNLYSQQKVLRPSEFQFYQNGIHFDLVAQGQIYAKVKGKFGLWSFLYADTSLVEGVVGPCLINKHWIFGVGIGKIVYKRDSYTPTVLSATLSVFNEKNRLYIYGESTADWNWYQMSYDRRIGRKEKFSIGIFSQYTIGTGIQFSYKYNENISIVSGINYRTNLYGYGGKAILPRIAIQYLFQK